MLSGISYLIAWNLLIHFRDGEFSFLIYNKAKKFACVSYTMLESCREFAIRYQGMNDEFGMIPKTDWKIFDSSSK